LTAHADSEEDEEGYEGSPENDCDKPAYTQVQLISKTRLLCITVS